MPDALLSLALLLCSANVVGLCWLVVLLVRLQTEVRACARATRLACKVAGKAAGVEVPMLTGDGLDIDEPVPSDDVLFSSMPNLGAWVPSREPVKR